MAKIRLLLTGLVLMFSSILFAQSIEGTYQVQVLNSRMQPNIPANLNQIILKHRDENQVKFIQLGTQVRLKILPLTEIRKPGFKPLERIVNIYE